MTLGIGIHDFVAIHPKLFSCPEKTISFIFTFLPSFIVKTMSFF